MVTQERPEDGQTAPAGAKRSGAPLAGANLLREEWLKARGNSSMPAVAGGTAGRSDPSTEATRTRRYRRPEVSSSTRSRTTAPTGSTQSRPLPRMNAGFRAIPAKAPAEGPGQAIYQRASSCDRRHLEGPGMRHRCGFRGLTKGPDYRATVGISSTLRHGECRAVCNVRSGIAAVDVGPGALTLRQSHLSPRVGRGARGEGPEGVPLARQTLT